MNLLPLNSDLSGRKGNYPLFKEINDCQIYYEIHGNPTGETIFFIHGAPGLGDCKNDVKAFSSLRDQYQLIFMDMRGSGRSEDKPPYTHGQWTADIDAFRESLGLEKIHILGGSYGGYLALEYVLAYPQRVISVMLRDTAANNKYNDDSVRRAVDANIPNLDIDMLERLFDGRMASNEELKKIFTDIQPLYTVVVDEEKIKKRMEEIYYHFETHNYAFSTNKKTFDIVDRLGEIKVPVLITVGIHDWITPVACSDELAAGIPNNTYIKYQHSGHSPHLEENELYLQNVRKFLQEVSLVIN